MWLFATPFYMPLLYVFLKIYTPPLTFSLDFGIISIHTFQHVIGKVNMQYSFTKIVYIIILCVFTFCSVDVLSDQYVTVHRENGDRLTGRWLSATETHFEIEYNSQILKFPLEGNTLSFFSNLQNIPNQLATKYYQNGLDLLDIELPGSAKRTFELAIQESPKYADAHYQLGLLNKKEGNMQKALVHFKSVLLIDAQRYDLVSLLQEMAENAIAAEDYTAAVNAYRLIIAHYPEHQSIAKINYQTGFLFVEKLGDPAAALDLLIDATTRYSNSPDHEKAVYLIGTIQANLGDYEVALNTLRQFVRIYQDSVYVNDALLKQATIHLQLGNRKNAVDIANLILRKTPDDASVVEQAKDVIRASVWNIYTEFLPDLSIQAIAIDGSTLWIGTPKGIVHIETGGNDGWKVIEGAAWMINTHTETVPDVRAITVNSSTVWIGTRNQGVLRYNKVTDKVEKYPIADGPTWIRDIEMDSDEIWFATDRGIVRQIIEVGQQFRYHGNDPVPDDIHSIALTPDTVWVGTSGDDIAAFDRERQIWNRHYFIDITQETQIVKFDVIDGKMLFSWYNEEDKNNGFFHTNWDGTNGRSSSIYEGAERKEELISIYVAGYVDESLLEVDDVEPPGYQVLWIADNEYVTIYHPINDEYAGSIGYPNIVLEELKVQCITVDKNRAWIGTSQGMLTVEKDKIIQPTE